MCTKPVCIHNNITTNNHIHQFFWLASRRNKLESWQKGESKSVKIWLILDVDNNSAYLQTILVQLTSCQFWMHYLDLVWLFHCHHCLKFEDTARGDPFADSSCFSTWTSLRDCLSSSLLATNCFSLAMTLPIAGSEHDVPFAFIQSSLLLWEGQTICLLPVHKHWFLLPLVD